MKRTLSQSKDLLGQTYGRCINCARTAFWFTLGVWAALVAVRFIIEDHVFVTVILLIAFGLTANTLIHLFMYSLRRATHASTGDVVTAADQLGHSTFVTQSANSTRRDFMQRFIGATAAAMVLILLPRSAKAACGDCAAANGAGWHDCITYSCNNVGQACCPPGYPYLNHCDCQCYDGTNFDCGSYSNCNYCG